MSEKKKHQGFLEYLDKHEFTPNFIHDFEYWAKRIFKLWKFLTEFDDFYENCWEGLLSKIDEYDPNIGTFQTFCISRINNEALRIYMRNKQRHGKIQEIDCDDPVIQADLVQCEGTQEYLFFDGFVRYCESLGVTVDVRKLYEDYSEEKFTPPVIAFANWKMMCGEVEGRNDIQKRK